MRASSRVAAVKIDLSESSAVSGAPSRSGKAATAESLAANKGEDDLLRTMIALSPWSREC
jgi:hypothetical protein